MWYRKCIFILTFVLSFFGLKSNIIADYKATVLITDGSKCHLASNSTGKCFFANTNFNSTVPGVVWLDTGDVVTVIEGATYASSNKNYCDTYYVKATFAFTSNPNKTYTGYFCNSNLVRDGQVSSNYQEEFRKAGFPDSYFSKLSIMKQAHPNWQFKAINTNLDFYQAVEEENTLGRSLIQVTGSTNDVGYLNTWSGSYNYYTDSFKTFDGSNWYAANADTIAYYMDPRNFLVDMYIFQYEALAYEKDIQTLSVVQKLLNGDYLNKFASSYITAASESKVSPVYLASLSKQEVGGYSYATTAVSGTTSSYPGIYNPYNIGATSGSNPVYNGLYWASGSGQKTNTYDRPWNSMDKAIRNGAKWIGENYINVGQNTIYFKKWDVVSNVNANSGSNYTHQYQTNIQAPISEGTSVYRSYNASGILNSPFIFYIPVYKNMPTQTSLPKTGSPNNYLKNLTINDVKVSSFDGGVTNYNYYVDANTNSIVIKAEAVNKNASISGTGYLNTANSGTHTITVTAQNGAVRKYNINIVKEKVTNPEPEVEGSVQSVLNKAGVKNNNNYIKGFNVNTNITEIINKIKNADSNTTITVKDKNNKVLSSGVVKTGVSFTIKTKIEEKTLLYCLYGDVDGDGKISAVDYVQIKNNIMNKGTLSGVYKEAADVDRNGSISAVDYVRIKNSIMGNYTITQ